MSINDRPGRALVVGVAEGGPLDGQELDSRFLKGILVVNKQDQKVWLYDFTDGKYIVREEEGRAYDDDRRWHAADGGDYDVRSV